jgi:heme exporter protein A
MLEACNLECVRGHRQLFRNVSFSMRPGDGLLLRGPNGSGKTSLLRMLSGLLPPTSGSVRWHGAPIETLRDAYPASLTYLGHRAAMKDELTALENLRVSSALSGFAINRKEAHDLLERVGLGGRENLHARYLSAGQRRKLALAWLVACRRSLWLLDEVLTSLDEAASGSVASFIDAHLSGGGIAVIATHQELKLSAHVSQRIELAA